MSKVSGFTVEHTMSGKPTFAHIDLRKHAHLIPVLENNGFEIEQPIKWTEKMKQAFEEEEFTVLDINNFWGECKQ